MEPTHECVATADPGTSPFVVLFRMHRDLEDNERLRGSRGKRGSMGESDVLSVLMTLVMSERKVRLLTPTGLL